MAISSSDCTPYVSATLFRTERTDEAHLGQVRTAIRSTPRDQAEQSTRPQPPERTFSTPADGTFSDDRLNLAWFHYAERRPPPWYGEGDLKETHHHVVIICRKGPLISVSFSEAGARNYVVRKISTATAAPFSALTRLSAQQMNAAFVESGIRTLWLSGAHRRTLIKPDAKVLSGMELESALDPLEDQSYYFSSVRSTSSNERLETRNGLAVIGASPRHGRVWLGPSRSWDEFTDRMSLLLDQAAETLAGALPDKPPIPILAQPSRSTAGIQHPYDMAIIVPELLLAGSDATVDEERWLQQFSDTARFDVKPVDGRPDFEADVFWGEEGLGTLVYRFEDRTHSGVSLNVETKDWKDDSEQNKLILKICKDGSHLTVYFDTGHTYARGSFYQTQFRDARFEDWRWVKIDPAQVKVRQEKPLDGRRFAVEDIGQSNDPSLFGLVARHWPDLEESGLPSGWLVCDDGAMESADFIHFDDTTIPRRLSLIHVKGSHSKSPERGLSVSDYEVVVGQAVKNLRHIDRGLLAEKLNANKSGILKDAVWYNGKRQRDREGVLAALRGAGSNIEKTVIILQPRVRKSVYGRIRERMDGASPPNAEVRRMQQLDALLLAARADCIGLGARFEVIAEDDS